MIDVKEHIEERLQETIILVTSFDQDNDVLWFLAVTQEGTKHTSSVKIDVGGKSYANKDFEGRVLDAGEALIKDIRKLRNFMKAQQELERARSSIEYIRNNQPDIYARGMK